MSQDKPTVHEGKLPVAVDLTRAAGLTPEVEKAINQFFMYHPYDADQNARSHDVRLALASAVKVIVQNVRPSPERSTAIRKIKEAAMDCNSGIAQEKLS